METEGVEDCWGKSVQTTSDIPIVKFTKIRKQSTSPYLVSRQSDDSGDSGRFVVSFNQLKKKGKTSKRPKHSRSQQFLSVFSQETSECDSDSVTSCCSESKIERTSRKKLRTASSAVHRPELSNIGASDRDSVSSNDSSFRVENVSRLSAIFDIAKNRGRQLVHSHKNKKFARLDQAITVGEDALCVEARIGLQNRNCATAESAVVNKDPLAQSSTSFDRFHTIKAANGEQDEVLNSEQRWFQISIERHQILPFLRHRIPSSLLLLSFSILFPGFVSGFLWGLYISFLCFLYFFVSKPMNKNLSIHSNDVLYTPEEFNEHETSRNKVYKGWMNELRGKYDSSTYHVNNAQTVLVCLDGNILRISRPERAVLKHAFHTDPTLTEAEPTFASQTIYSLKGATVTLRPKRLAKRRWWSRKYPIHIRLPSRNGEISTFPSPTVDGIRKSHSVNGAIKSLELIETIYDNDVKQPSLGNFASDLQYALDAESNEENSENASLCSNESENDRSKDLARSRSLYFFVRSAREKERWFHRLREACSQCNPGNETTEIKRPRNGLEAVLRDRRFSLPLLSADSDRLKLSFEHFLYANNREQFNKCVDEVLKISREENRKRTHSNIIYMDLGRNKWKPGTADSGSQLVMSVNALAARIFYDFCRDRYWCKQVRDKIQSKLATLNLPYFIEALELSNLDLGSTPPEIVNVRSPILDDWGLWIDFEVKYRGGIHLTLETKVNLMRLKQGLQKSDVYSEVREVKIPMRLHHYSDSDLPESPESSPDEDFGSKTEKAQINRESTGKKLLNVVDKIASSIIFQGASEFAPVKKMMEGISSTRLLLNVDIIRLEGIMTINIPPPPSDRLWYAFRIPPELSIRSVPQVGDKLVDVSTVSSWIESKLRLLLEKNLVCPNMDDLIIPVMSGNKLLNGVYSF